MSRINLELILKIVSAVIKAVISVVFGVEDDKDSEYETGN